MTWGVNIVHDCNLCRPAQLPGVVRTCPVDHSSCSAAKKWPTLWRPTRTWSVPIGWGLDFKLVKAVLRCFLSSKIEWALYCWHWKYRPILRVKGTTTGLKSLISITDHCESTITTDERSCNWSQITPTLTYHHIGRGVLWYTAGCVHEHVSKHEEKVR